MFEWLLLTEYPIQLKNYLYNPYKCIIWFSLKYTQTCLVKSINSQKSIYLQSLKVNKSTLKKIQSVFWSIFGEYVGIQTSLRSWKMGDGKVLSSWRAKGKKTKIEIGIYLQGVNCFVNGFLECFQGACSI